MIGRYEAFMNGIALSSIDNSILVLDVNHTPASVQRRTSRVANRNGSRVFGEYYSGASATITFEIHEYDTIKRQSICDKVAQWAVYGKYLTTSDRPWRRLRCSCDTPPSIQSAKKWTDPITMTFVAYQLPFWEEMNEVKLSMTGTNKTGTLYVPGNVKDTLVTARIEANASCANVTLGVGHTHFDLKNLNLADDDVVWVEYDDDMNLIIRKGATSLLAKRSGNDDLLADSGKLNTLYFISSASVTVDFLVRGWWL